MRNAECGLKRRRQKAESRRQQRQELLSLFLLPTANCLLLFSIRNPKSAFRNGESYERRTNATDSTNLGSSRNSSRSRLTARGRGLQVHRRDDLHRLQGM